MPRVVLGVISIAPESLVILFNLLLVVDLSRHARRIRAMSSHQSFQSKVNIVFSEFIFLHYDCINTFIFEYNKCFTNTSICFCLLSGSERRRWRFVGRHNAYAHARDEHPLCRALHSDPCVPPARTVLHRQESLSLSAFFCAAARAPLDRNLCLPRNICLLSRKVLQGALLQQLIEQQNLNYTIIFYQCFSIAKILSYI